MKKTLIAATALIAALTGTAASAQAYYGYDRDYRGHRYERQYDRRDYDRRWDHRDRRDYDRRYSRWARGQYLPSHYRGYGYYVDDYRRYGYGAPPRGYRYYRTDTGDIVLAAIATGLIISVLSN